jgi:hypothetical protein
MASKGEDVVHAHLAAPIVAGSVLEESCISSSIVCARRAPARAVDHGTAMLTIAARRHHADVPVPDALSLGQRADAG